MRMTACFIILFALTTSISHAEPFTADHLVMIDRIGAPAVSPDGRSVIYAVRHTDLEADRGRYDLWSSPLSGG
ncbi:MAG: hypothetical protein V2J20_08260, partial [Wenzhouxiangella sp.]|nr:hypothetical protein [Wenzhouxiangella sp.]